MYGGLDIGSSNIKFSIYTHTGQLTVSSSLRYPPAAQAHRLSMETVWSAARQVIADCAHRLPGSVKLEGFAISACGEIITPVDEDGRALCDSMIGSAPEGGEELRRLVDRFDAAGLYQITGLLPAKRYSAVRLLWYREHTDLFRRAAGFSLVEDFIIRRLTGRSVVSYSSASRSLLFDRMACRWSAPLLDFAGIDPERLPVCVPSGTCAGTLLPSVAAELGLSSEVKVYTGGHDQLCNALGAGLPAPGTAFNCSGTFECIGTLLSSPAEQDAFFSQRLQISPSFAGTDPAFVFWAPVAGASSLDWLLRVKAGRALSRQELSCGHAALQADCTSAPSPVMALPYFTGRNYPDAAPALQGGFLGLTHYTTDAQLYQGLMESIVFELRLCLERMAGLGIRPERLRITGGGSRSALWSQMRADILGLPVEKTDDDEAGSLGCMMLAAVGDGYFPSLETAAAACIRVGRVFRPDPRQEEAFAEKYQRYLALRTCIGASDQ